MVDDAPVTVDLATRPRLSGLDSTAAMRARRTLVQFGQPDDVRMLDRHLRGSGGPPTIVIVGEVKRGKSTLFNALVGSDLSPMGADLSTEGTVAVVPPSRSLPAGRAELVFPGRVQPSTAEEAVRALTPASDTWLHEPPLAARIAWTSRWLSGAALIDTPGVGGLASVHGRRARLAAAEATALLFVSDGGQTLTASELDFLREISGHTEHVVLVLTKIDRNPGGWEEVRAANRALLRKHAPRFASVAIHPVSATYARYATTQPPEVAGRLDRASGLPALAATLRELVADSRRLDLANALRAGHTALERVEARVELEINALSDTAVVAGLEEESARLSKLRKQQRRSRLDLERDLGRVRQSAVAHLNERSDALIARLSERIQHERRGMSAAAKQQFTADLGLELSLLATDVRDFVAVRLTSLIEDAFGSLEEVPTDADVSAQLEDVTTRVRIRQGVSVSPLLDPSVAGTAFLGSHLVGLAGLAGPVGLVLGGGAMIALNLAFRGMRQGQQELAGTLHDSVTGAKQDLVAGVDSWLRELRPELHLALEDFVKDAITAVRTVIAEAEKRAQDDAATRRSTTERLERRRLAVQARRLALEERLLELTVREHPPAVPQLSDTTTTGDGIETSHE